MTILQVFNKHVSFEIMKKHIGFCNRLSLEPLKVEAFALLILFALFISLVSSLSTLSPGLQPPLVYCPHTEATVPGASWNLPHERSSENIWYVNDLNLVKSCSISCPGIFLSSYIGGIFKHVNMFPFFFIMDIFLMQYINNFSG